MEKAIKAIEKFFTVSAEEREIKKNKSSRTSVCCGAIISLDRCSYSENVQPTWPRVQSKERCVRDEARSLGQRVDGERFTGETGVSAPDTVELRVPRFHQERATFASVGCSFANTLSAGFSVSFIPFRQESPALQTPSGKFMAEDLYARKRWHRVQYLTEQFWSRWKKEYPANITLRQRWHSSRRNVKIGDSVIVKEEEIPCSEWRLGRVLGGCEDEDGLVRRVTIQLGNKKLGKEGQRLINPSILECLVLVENN
ncbi:uncharacterized protein LOC132401354 [Hypanus sabinus]|uniref:uncharacterized protein LOC132401354 n=1 Tax=Hypanus sabinus TaxID=79690 RepID=UPI0028C43547|nr:uncharacterized protein LOC132401354 [Hypanus sabinus]